MYVHVNTCACIIVNLYTYMYMYMYYCRLGDIENAVKYLELYVEVAEGIVSKETVMLAYCDAGVMFNSLVSTYTLRIIPRCTVCMQF